ncbi:MAG: DUF3459 domain-containing protein, partial [Treponema sp.]|nr:DUF3459 domain-containing protein [Treponema sp.]
EKDPASLLNTVRGLLALRRREKDLGGAPNFSVVYAESGKVPFVYRRGSLLAAVNPSGETAKAPAPAAGSPLYAIGDCSATGDECTLGPQSFGVWKLA